jgi:hypothetical protein
VFVGDRAAVWAEIERPNGTRVSLKMPAIGEQYVASFVASDAGLYSIRARASGRTFAGNPFTREQSLTAVVVPGGDQPSDRGQGGSRGSIVDLLCCLAEHGGLGNRLAEQLGIDPSALERCLGGICRERSGEPDRLR